MVAFTKHELQIQCWNVQGAFFNVDGDRYSKMHNDSDFEGHTKKYLIFGLIETHHTADDIHLLHVAGYRCFQVCRKKLKRGPKSGGICVYVHESISLGVSQVNTSGSESIIIRLKKDYFHLDRDIIVLFSYCVPAGSSYQIRTQFDPLEDFLEKNSNFNDSCDLVCLGDFNSRTACRPDYSVDDNITDIPVVNSLFSADTLATFPRGNSDLLVNSYGVRLLEICQSFPLRILNGRKLGDILGSYTCYKSNGQSVVDYCLVSPRIYSQVSSFIVNDFLPDLSDHCSITVAISTKYMLSGSLHNYNLLSKPRKVPWSDGIAVTFEGLLQDTKSKAFLAQFNAQSLSTQELLDSAVDRLSSFLVDAAIQAASSSVGTAKPQVPRKSADRNWKFRKKPSTVSKPKWFDVSCETLQRQLRVTSRLLKMQPSNQYLKSKLFVECKDYKRLRQLKKRQYVQSMFVELDEMHKSNPKGYMDLVKSLRDGSFDKRVAETTSHVSPENWKQHFQGLLGPNVEETPSQEALISFVEENCDAAKSHLDQPITRCEIIGAICGLKNNKAISFDKVSNEMIKTSKLIITNHLCSLFNKILLSSIYPSVWKNSILTPLHKSGELSDPNNFRGVAVSSCLGKLFNKILNTRLEKKCVKEGLVNDCQGSSKKGSRTADHLMIIRFLIDKYVNASGKKLFACFFDIRKAYDTVPRNLLFYTLLKDYNIGGNFLKILQKMYSENNIYIKLSEGLCEPFVSTVGVLQGETNSPLIFNLFVNKISEVFDDSCDPVMINNTPQSCLLWSDDLFVVSQSAEGLQNAISNVVAFYASLGLQCNSKKTKILIFNKSGRVLKGYSFFLAGTQLEIAEYYQYLGIKLRPSGSFTAAAEELSAKARRAWFSISSIIYKDKRITVERAFQLFDSLVSPVALYGCELWYPVVLPKKCFQGKNKLLSSWESFQFETLNQACARILLSVHRKASRLAVLGELGRHPLAVRAIAHCLNYRLCLASKPANTLLGRAMCEMTHMAQTGVDCWLSRANKMAQLLETPNIKFSQNSGRQLLKCVQSKFERYWMDEIKSSRLGTDGEEHNKLLTYSSFKCHFGLEPYINLVRNRNQRCHLSRLRVSAHRLGCELQRYCRPQIPRDQRYCKYCPLTTDPGGQVIRPVDSECHCLTGCVVGLAHRFTLFEDISSINSNFNVLCNVDKFKSLVCPVSAIDCKQVNKYLDMHFKERDRIDLGV